MAKASDLTSNAADCSGPWFHLVVVGLQNKVLTCFSYHQGCKNKAVDVNSQWLEELRVYAMRMASS